MRIAFLRCAGGKSDGHSSLGCRGGIAQAKMAIDTASGSAEGLEGPHHPILPCLSPSFGADIGEDKAQVSALGPTLHLREFYRR